jgi:hypothetical protein
MNTSKKIADLFGKAFAFCVYVAVLLAIPTLAGLAAGIAVKCAVFGFGFGYRFPWLN